MSELRNEIRHHYGVGVMAWGTVGPRTRSETCIPLVVVL